LVIHSPLFVLLNEAISSDTFYGNPTYKDVPTQPLHIGNHYKLVVNNLEALLSVEDIFIQS